MRVKYTSKYVNVCLRIRIRESGRIILWLTPSYFCLQCKQDMTGLTCQTPCEHYAPEFDTCTWTHTLHATARPPQGVCVHIHTAHTISSSVHAAIRVLRQRGILNVCMCPSLVLDMPLWLDQGSMDTDVWFSRNTFILSTRQWDCFI